MLTRDARLDFGLIRALRAAVPAPLVLHGSSGVADADLVRAVACGMTKVNIATHLNNAFTVSVREYLAAHPAAVDTAPTWGRPGLVAVEVTRLLGVMPPCPSRRTATRSPQAAMTRLGSRLRQSESRPAKGGPRRAVAVAHGAPRAP